MVTNIKYGDSLDSLKYGLQRLEKNLTKEKKDYDEHNKKLKWYKSDLKRSAICLILSVFLSLGVILAALYYIPIGYNSFMQTNDDPNGIFVLALFGIGIAIYLVNFILSWISEQEFRFSMLLCIIPPVFFIGAIAGGNILIKSYSRYIRWFNEEKEKINKSVETIASLEKDISDTKNQIINFEKNISNASDLYNRAIEENNHNLMQQAAAEGDSNAIKFLNDEAERKQREKAAELYAQATSGDVVDKELLKQAADLGDESACFDLGKELYLEFVSDEYTQEEKLEKSLEAEKYLKVFENSSNVEAKFLYYSIFVMGTIFDYDRFRRSVDDISKWKKALAELRNIKKSGELTDTLSEPLDHVIKKAVEAIDSIEEIKNKFEQKNKSKSKSTKSANTINECDSFTWTYDYVKNNEARCSDISLTLLDVSKELLEEGNVSDAALGFDKIVHGLELLQNFDKATYLPPLYANCYALARIFAFGLNNKDSARKNAEKACDYALKCNTSAARNDISKLRSFRDALQSSRSLSSIAEEFELDFPYDIING